MLSPKRTEPARPPAKFDMNEDRKQPHWPRIAALLIALPVMYVARIRSGVLLRLEVVNLFENGMVAFSAAHVARNPRP